MIYYKEEKKKLVIPSGFVMIPIDCDEAIEQAREQGYQEGFADGSSATCDTEEGTYSLTDDFDGEETVFPSEGKTGFNKIVIVDDGYGDAKYDEGYADGIADCSGSTPCDCSSAITEAYQSGYTEGYNQGQADCPECSGGTCNLQQKVFVVTDPAMENVFPDAGYDGLSQVMLLTSTLWDSAHTNGYNEGYQSGYTAGQADCDCTESYEIGYQDGYADGRESIASGCPMQEKFIRVSTIEESVTPDYGYAGLSEVHISAENFYNTAYNDGYAAGLEDCSGSTPCDCSSAITEAYQSGQTAGAAAQKALLVSTAITENGTYTRENGWNSVSINVPTTSGSCNLETGSASLGSSFDGDDTITPSQGYDGFSSIRIVDNGYGQSKYDSGYTEGYNEAITANCGSAITEAYESGVTEGQGSIFSLKINFNINNSWVTEVDYQKPVFIVDESGNSHQFIYQYATNPNKYRVIEYSDYNSETGVDTVILKYAGYLQDGAKYIQPYQVKFPVLNSVLWNSNISGLSVEINGEVIHNWQTGPYGDVYDDWQFGSGAWRFTPLATVVSDTYYDATHKMVTFYIQGQVPNNN